LTAAQLGRLQAYGTPQTVEAGDVLYGPGDATYDLVVTEDATIEIVQPATRDTPEESLVRSSRFALAPMGRSRWSAEATAPDKRRSSSHRADAM
jgi:hypothetical protein